MKKVFIALSLIILVFGLSIWFLYPKKDIKTTSQEEVKEIVQDKNEEDLKDENIEDNTINNNDDIRNDISSIQNSDKNNMESNDTSKSNVIKKETKDKKNDSNIKEKPASTQPVSKPEEKKQEEPKKEEQPEVKETEWSKLGLTEDQYKNQPMYSWEEVNFSTREECVNYGDNNPPYSTGEGSYDCNEVTSWTRTLGWDFVPHYR